MPVALATIPNIPVLSVGTWAASTGVFTVTSEDLYAACAAFDDPGYHRPYLKLGHVDSRFNAAVDDNGIPLDGQPALGRLINPRVTDDGMTLVVDIAGVPAWLAEVAPTAYPTRSIEGEFGHRTQTGTSHKFALTGLALLGATPPAVSTLGDIARLFGLDPVVVAASATTEEPMPQPVTVAASVNLDTVRMQFYGPENGTLREELGGSMYAWIREVYSDFVVVDDDEGHLFSVPWSENPDMPGQVVFGAPTQVRVEYVDMPTPAVAASGLQPQAETSLRRGALRTALAALPAVQPHTPEPVAIAPPSPEVDLPSATPDVPAAEPDAPTHQEDAMSLSEIRARLGLAEDADDAAVLTALDARLQPALPDDGTTQPDPEPTVAPEPAREPEPVAASKPTLPDGVVTVEASTLAELRAMAEAGQRSEKRQRTEDRDRYIAAAVGDGKFAPARKDHWTKAYDADPEGTRQTIDGLEKNLIPVAATGTAGPVEEADPYAVDTASAGGWAKSLGIPVEELTR